MLITRTKTGPPLVTTAEAASYLKVTEPSEHPLIAGLVESATLACEFYTGRDVRANEYELLRDDFSDEASGAIVLRASLVASVSEVARMVSGTFTAVTASDYVLIPELSCARVELAATKAWPTDLDLRRHNVRVRFATEAHKFTGLCRDGILRHVALLHADRGDAEPASSGAGGPGGFNRTTALDTARQSGATQIYSSIALVGI